MVTATAGPTAGVRAYGTLRLWKAVAHLLADLPIAVILFSTVTTALSVSAGLLVSLLGVPLLLATIHGGRYVALAETARARLLLDLDLPRHPPLQLAGTWWAKLWAVLGDKAGWTGLAYAVVLLPWSVVTFTLLVVVATVGPALALAPLYVWGMDLGDLDLTAGDRALIGGLLGAAGGVLVWLFPLLVRALAEVDRALVGRLLAPSPTAALAHRVSQLEESRDASVASSAAELRRIERDLHDGAQQRLVSLAMHTGLAKERLRRHQREGIGDDRALELVELAHDEAKQAIAELRDLVRGIHPAVLTDRGLDAAVSALVARCPVPVTVTSDLDRRLPPAVEGAAYFVIAEALTNLAKHSGAETGSVRLADRGDRLLVEIHDDGGGGATEGPDGGLRGLRDRVAGVEGRLRLASPPGGPTAIVVELPCAP